MDNATNLKPQFQNVKFLNSQSGLSKVAKSSNNLYLFTTHKSTDVDELQYGIWMYKQILSSLFTEFVGVSMGFFLLQIGRSNIEVVFMFFLINSQ